MASLRFRMRFPRHTHHRKDKRNTQNRRYENSHAHMYKNLSRRIPRGSRRGHGLERMGRHQMEYRCDDRKQNFENQPSGRYSRRDSPTYSRRDSPTFHAEEKKNISARRSIEIIKNSDEYQYSLSTDRSRDENIFENIRSRSAERVQSSDNFRCDSVPESRSPVRYQRSNNNCTVTDLHIGNEFRGTRGRHLTPNHHPVRSNQQDCQFSSKYLDNYWLGKYVSNMNQHHDDCENIAVTNPNPENISRFDRYPNESMTSDDKAAHMVKLLMSNGGEMIATNFKREMMKIFPTEKLLLQFLEKFKSLFVIKSTSTLEEEEGEISDTKKALVLARTDLKLCMDYSSSSQNCAEIPNLSHCGDLHICKFFILNQCPSTNCKFGHLLTTTHNDGVLRRHFLHTLTKRELADLLKMHANRRGVTIPLICRFYNLNKCNKENCPFLHICNNLDTCRLPSCKRNHTLTGEQPSIILSKYGLTPGNIEGGNDSIFTLLRTNPDSVEMHGANSYDEMKLFPKHRNDRSLSIKIFENNESDKFQWSVETDEGCEIKLYDTESSELEEKYAEYLEAKRIWIKATGRNIAVDLSRLEGIVETERGDKIVKLIRDKRFEDQ